MSGDYDDIFHRREPGWQQRVADPRPAPPEEQTAGSGPYKPYGYTPSEDLETCDVAWWMPDDSITGQELQYRFLVRLSYQGDAVLWLMMTDCVICLEGRNLRDLRKRLARRRITFIQAFNSRVWQQPPEGEPIITKISMLYPGETNGRLPT